MERSPYGDPVRFAVLGPLRVDLPAGQREIRGAKERLLLAHLVARAGSTVPVTDLVEALWGEDPPRTATKSLQTYVLRLRNTLEPDRAGAPAVLLTEGGGYRLAAEPEQLDFRRFERLLARAEDGPVRERLELLDEALELWRGPAYAGLADGGVLGAEATRLEEMRLDALADRCELQLGSGRARAAIAELQRLVAEHPLRERLWALLVTGLYREGRQADALGAYERARTHLADELGIDPGPELRSLHARVLAQDPTLAGPPSGPVLPPELSDMTPLRGRERELVVLRDAWQRSASEPQVVVVRARGGAGARRLVGALAQEVTDGGAKVAYVGPGSSSPPVGGADLVVLDRLPDPAPPRGTPMTVVVAGPREEAPTASVELELGPLDRASLRELVADHVHDDLDEATDRVLEASDGWPARAHAAAVGLVRARAAAEVGAATVEAGSSRASLHAARERLAAGVLDLRAADPPGRPDPDRCPWPGLTSYDVADSAWFAGRERLVAELVARAAVSRCVMVAGASGSGKSSLVRAGLLGALADDQLPGSAGWETILMRPGVHPLRELTQQVLGARRPDPGAVLERLVRSPATTGGDRVVLVVDQLEELWTECADSGEQATFLDTLADLAADDASPTTLLLVLRADYLDRLADHPDLAELVAEDAVLVGAPTRDDVRRAVERPAAAAGLELDDGLVDAIVADAGEEPGVLPLLSTALAQLWQARSGRRLTFGDYVALGGVDGAIAHLAEDAWRRLDGDHQAVARQVLLRLTGPGEGDQVVRRRVAVAELTGLDLPHVHEVLEALTSARLVTRAGDHVEVAHEALFREWPRLRAWLAEDAAGRAIQRRLAVAAAEWEAEGRDPALLWRGPRLEAGLGAAAARPEELTETERTFLETSRAAAAEAHEAAERQVATERRQNRRLRTLLGGVGLLLVVSLVAGLLALVARGRATDAAEEAERSALAAEAKRLAASALSIEYPDLALLAAVEATRLEQSPETYGALLTLLARQPDVVTSYRTPERFLRIGATPDGRTVLVSENRPVLRALDATTGEQVWERDVGGQVGAIAPGPDGSTVAVTVLTEDGGGVELLDVRDGHRRWRIDEDEATARAGERAAPWIWYGLGWTSPEELVFASDTHVFTASDSGRITGVVPWGHRVADTQTLVALPDGTVTTGPSEAGAAVRLDLRSGRATALHGESRIVTASPSGDRVLVSLGDEDDPVVALADPRTLRPVSRRWPVGGSVGEAAFAPDGRSLALAVDEQVLLRDGRSAAPLRAVEGHSGTVLGLAYAGPRSELLWTAGRDGRAVAFDPSGEQGVIGTRRTADAPHAGERTAGVSIWLKWQQFAPSEAYLSAPGDVRGRPLPLTGLEDCECLAGATELTPDGRLALAGMLRWKDGPVEDKGHVVLWDTRTRRVRGVVDTPWPVLGVSSTPDGASAVVAGPAHWAVLDLDTLVLGQVHDARPLDVFASSEGTALVEVAPDGRRAALLRTDAVVVVDLGTGETLATREIDPGYGLNPLSAGWTPDSEELVVGSARGWLHVLDGDDLRSAAPRRLITGGWVIDVEVSPDGRVAATLGSDGDTTLWDVATWRPYGLPVTDDRWFGYLAFEEDSSALEVAFEDGTATRIGVRPEDWVAAACAAANRDLTTDEVAVLLPDADARDTVACDRD